MNKRIPQVVVAGAVVVLAGVLFTGPLAVGGQTSLRDFVAPVRVVNTSAQPVPVVSLATAPEEPIYAIGSGSFIPGVLSGVAQVFTVPADKRLVIEHLSAGVVLSADQTTSGATLDVIGPGGGFRTHFVLMSLQGPTGNPLFHIFVASQPIRFYAEPGSTVRFQINRTAGIGTTNFNAAISGYLVPLPQ